MKTHKVLERRIEEALLLATARPDEAARVLGDFIPEATFRVSKEVDTARIVRKGQRYRIEFGEAFLEHELSDPKDLAFVFLHEVYHHVLGHLASLPPAYRTPAWYQVVNLAADMMVNRVVSQRYFPTGPPLLERMYRPDRFPECLLLPPSAFGMPLITCVDPRTRAGHLARSRLDRALKQGLSAAGLGPSVRMAACRVYHAGWLENVPFDCLLGLVGNLVRRVLGERLWEVRFLGNHDPDAERLTDLPWCAADCEDDEVTGGYSDTVIEDEIDEDVKPCFSPALAMAVSRALVNDPNHPRLRFGREPQTGVLFAPGRSDWLLIANGQWPALFHGPAFGPVDDDQRAHVYLDVSGSVEPWIGRIYGLVLALGDEIGSPVHLFSNEVLDVTLDDLASGKVFTTGGTDFDCVIRHALVHGFRRIVVITDGIGDLSDENGEAFKAAGASLYLLLMGVGRDIVDKNPLANLARGIWDLE